MRVVRAALENLRLDRLDRDDDRVGRFLLQDLPDAGDRASRADARHEGVEFAARVAKDLASGRLAVDLQVRRVVELPRQPCAKRLGRELLGHSLRLFDPLRPRREHELRAEGLEELAPLDRHRVGHDQIALVALRRRHEGQADARVAAGGLDDRIARLELAGLLRFIHHRDGDSILDGRKRVERLELDHNLGRSLRDDLVQAHHRRVPDQFRDAVVDLSVLHRSPPLPFTKQKTRATVPGSHSNCRLRERARTPSSPFG